MSNWNAGGKAKTKCYIINNRTNKKLEFQFNPTSVPYSRSAVYTTIDSPGISYPLTQYTGGNIREFPIELFYYDLHYDKNHVRKSSGKIKEARQFLEALLPPEKNTKTFVPPTFTFAYGYFVKTLVLVQLSIDDEWMDEDGQPIQTRFSLTVRQVGS